jgi:AraC-like DNA-binding protein
MKELTPVTLNPYSNNDVKKHDLIAQSHKYREKLLFAIECGDKALITQFTKEIERFLKEDSLDIFKRIPNNKLRSYKNFLLSHNTLYSYSAEKGGLSAWQCHYISEKYAIMIEHTDSIAYFKHIHSKMLNEYSDLSLRSQKSENPTIVEKAEEYITMNFAENISIEEIARKLHVHPSHLMRLFKKEKGMTLSRYRNLKRIKEAKELLIHSNLSITEVGFMVGFNNPQYFTKVFKKEEAITPKEYKRKNSNYIE